MDKANIIRHIEDILAADSGLSLKALHAISRVNIDHKLCQLTLNLGYPSEQQVIDTLVAEIEKRFDHLYPEASIQVNVQRQLPRFSHDKTVMPLPNIQNILLVSSGKGGVGKSTISSQLASALQILGARVGLLDADIYGPNQPLMLGQDAQAKPGNLKAQMHHGIAVMSMGYLVEKDAAVIWRGPMISNALMQMLTQTPWPPLDYLIIDLPPGTGDIPLTLAKKVPVTASIVVGTAQNVAASDVERCIQMWGKVNLPILGIVENMSSIVCPGCKQDHSLFSGDALSMLAKKHGLATLAKLPFDPALTHCADQGTPLVLAKPQHPLSQALMALAKQVSYRLACFTREERRMIATGSLA